LVWGLMIHVWVGGIRDVVIAPTVKINSVQIGSNSRGGPRSYKNI
jgi:hypothetical protein